MIDPPTKKTAVLSLEEGADGVGLRKLRERFHSLLERQFNHFVVDLKHANSIKTSTLASLLELNRHCQNIGVEFTLINLSDRVTEILRLTKLDRVFFPSGGDQTSPTSTSRPTSRPGSYPTRR